MIQFGPGPDGGWYVTHPAGFLGPVPAAKAIHEAQRLGAAAGETPMRVEFPSPPRKAPEPEPQAAPDVAAEEPAPKKSRTKKVSPAYASTVTEPEPSSTEPEPASE